MEALLTRQNPHLSPSFSFFSLLSLSLSYLYFLLLAFVLYLRLVIHRATTPKSHGIYDTIIPSHTDIYSSTVHTRVPTNTVLASTSFPNKHHTTHTGKEKLTLRNLTRPLSCSLSLLILRTQSKHGFSFSPLLRRKKDHRQSCQPLRQLILPPPLPPSLTAPEQNHSSPTSPNSPKAP